VRGAEERRARTGPGGVRGARLGRPVLQQRRAEREAAADAGHQQGPDEDTVAGRAAGGRVRTPGAVPAPSAAGQLPVHRLQVREVARAHVRAAAARGPAVRSAAVRHRQPVRSVRRFHAEMTSLFSTHTYSLISLLPSLRVFSSTL